MPRIYPQPQIQKKPGPGSNKAAAPIKETKTGGKEKKEEGGSK